MKIRQYFVRRSNKMMGFFNSILLSLLAFNVARAEIELVSSKNRVVLMTSERRASLGQEFDVNGEVNTFVHQLCARINKSKSSYEIAMLNETEKAEKIYSASTLDQNQAGVVFVDGTFSIVPYPQIAKETKSETAEKICYMGSLGSFVMGGLGTLLVGIGFEGPPDSTATIIFGCVTGGVTALCAISGGIIRLYRKCRERDIPLVDIEMPTGPSYAYPILASRITCY